ncbi:MAG: hypothetical protein ACRELD_05420 [Longimicrobiales bacterium]
MHEIVDTEIPLRRFEAFPRLGLLLGGALVGLGVVAFVVAVGQDAERAWRAYLVNWLYFTSIAQGGVILGAAMVITKAIWARPVRRIAISMVAFLPVAFVLMLPILVAAEHIFPWVHEPVPAKQAYLNVPFMATRVLVGVGALFMLSLVFAYWALRPDAGLLKANGHARGGIIDFLTRRWQGQEVEEARATRKLSRLAPVLVLVFAAGMSFVAWDFVMSLEPEWWSTLIGPYFFMAAFLGAVAATAIGAAFYRRRFGLEEIIQPPHLHDLGKLTFGFCVFWAYLFFSQYIVIWYGQLPIEQDFVIHRLEPPFKWLSVAVLFGLFVVPFFGLLGVAPKKNPLILIGAAIVVLVGLWIERYLLVYPSFYHGASDAPLGWQELGIALPFAGLFSLALAWMATHFPVVQLWEPLWEPELEERPDAFLTAS